MLQEKYDNSSYWVDIHQNFTGTLRAVGWPTLSEEFNKLKYLSESESFLLALERALGAAKAADVLEIGVGIGFFTALQAKYCEKQGIKSAVTALDISPEALSLVKEKFPGIRTMQADLKTIDLDACAKQYDLVTAIMVLLHLTDINDYIHALTFCARSVKDGGHLLIYEPLINRDYSPFNSIEYDRYAGNSIPRPSSLVDNVLIGAGLTKSHVLPGASWLLNSPIQANSTLAFKFKHLIWVALVKLVFRSDKRTGLLSRFLVAVDRMLKRSSGDSGTFVLYKKVS